jgi:uncharacterized membrane protein (Fun14 family)
VIKLVAITAGLFLAGLVYLRYQQIASINWDKLERMSERVVNTVVNVTTNMIEGGHPYVAQIGIRYEQTAKYNK